MSDEQQMQPQETEQQADKAVHNVENPLRLDNYYQKERQAFAARAAQDLTATLDRHGFAFFHSLPPKERALYREKLGIQTRDAADLYNLGVAHMLEGEMKKAVQCWESALKCNPRIAEAEYNLGLAYEELNDPKAARAHFERYLQIADDASGILEVQEHLALMGGK